MISGIYTIASPSGKRYVGSAVHFGRRWSIHRVQLRKGTHHSKALQRAFNKYGESGLVFRKLFICSKEDLLFYEQRTFDVLKPEYNMCLIAGTTSGIKLGPHSPERIAERVNKIIGQKRTLQQRLNISISRKGQPSKNKGIKTGKPAWNLGKKSSEETKAKQRGPKSLEHCIKIAKAKARQVQCVETGQVFDSVRAAGQQLKDLGLTINKTPEVKIDGVINKTGTAYGYHWILIDEGK